MELLRRVCQHILLVKRAVEAQIAPEGNFALLGPLSDSIIKKGYVNLKSFCQDLAELEEVLKHKSKTCEAFTEKVSHSRSTH